VSDSLRSRGRSAPSGMVDGERVRGVCTAVSNECATLSRSVVTLIMGSSAMQANDGRGALLGLASARRPNVNEMLLSDLRCRT
jgi:hypothetical protein